MRGAVNPRPEGGTVRQTTLCVPLEVKPESCARLTRLIDDFRTHVDNSQTSYGLISTEVPALHFMSMSVFLHHDYDPIFILEANFDGPAGALWDRLEATFGGELREMLRCCKRPLDDDAPLYDSVAGQQSPGSIARYFEARTQRPSVFHHGNRGLDRNRILSDEALFRQLRQTIDGPAGASPYRGIAAEDARRALRAAVLPQFPWLDEKRPTRIGLAESITDLSRLLLYAAVLLLVLSLPGLILAPLLPTRPYLILMLGAALLIMLLVANARHGLPGTEVPAAFPWSMFKPRFVLLFLLAVAVYVGLATVLLIPVVFAASHLLAWLGVGVPLAVEETWRPVARTVGLGLVALAVMVPLLLLRIRYLERRDSSIDEPQLDDRILREMIRREDWIVQNHMGSIVLIKPGVLRTIIIRAGHFGLGLVLRVTARSGYLGSMRTVPFAHWAFLNNGSRLLFLSNYDHSWGSYLDDFIEKAANGLTIAWGSGVGFPPARFLILDGAAHGRQFKNWALASRAVSRFWYSAYRDLTVDQIERNHRIANGLRHQRLSEAKAEQWMRDL